MGSEGVFGALNKRVRLLVVGEQDQYENLLREHVELSSHLYNIEYRFVASGYEALRIIPVWAPSLVLVDAFIEDINSFEFIRRCRSIRTKVALISDVGSIEIERSALDRGAEAYFQTNPDPETLDRLLAKIVSIADELSHLQ